MYLQIKSWRIKVKHWNTLTWGSNIFGTHPRFRSKKEGTGTQEGWESLEISGFSRWDSISASSDSQNPGELPQKTWEILGQDDVAQVILGTIFPKLRDLLRTFSAANVEKWWENTELQGEPLENVAFHKSVSLFVQNSLVCLFHINCGHFRKRPLVYLRVILTRHDHSTVKNWRMSTGISPSPQGPKSHGAWNLESNSSTIAPDINTWSSINPRTYDTRIWYIYVYLISPLMIFPPRYLAMMAITQLHSQTKGFVQRRSDLCLTPLPFPAFVLMTKVGESVAWLWTEAPVECWFN